MDWISMWNSVADQGALFWTATSAVALGLTLILVAGVMHLQRWRHRSSGTRSSELVSNSEAKPVMRQAPPAVSDEQVQDSTATPGHRQESLEIQNYSPRSPESTGSTNSAEMLVLSARLRKAADRLEDHRRTNGENPVTTGDSPLKESLDGVDYLFRTGTA